MPSSPLSLPPTADLCDADESRGILSIIAPNFRDYGGVKTFAGPIATVHCADDNSRVRDMIAAPGAGRVLVIDGGASLACALLGGNLARQAAQNDWRGIVINGCVRDATELATTPIGIRALAAVPNRSRKRQTGTTNIPVRFADTLFLPGHYLVADQDGMILSPTPL